MIQFYGRMYNYTTGEFIDNSPSLYSIAQYTGSSIGVGDDGTTRTDIPFNEFSINAGNNIGVAFEFCAKEYFDNNNEWPVLRLCTSNDPSTYFLEWVHSNPTGFNIAAPGIYVRWASTFQWSDAYTAPFYNSMYSFVFSSAGSVDELENIVISWSGAVRANDSTGGIDTLISYATFQISAPQNCLVSNAGAFIGALDERKFYKTYDGPMITVFQQSSAGWMGPVSFCPAANNGDMPPYNGSFTANENVSTIANYEAENGTYIPFTARYQYHVRNPNYVDTANLPILRDEWDVGQLLNFFFDSLGVQITYIRTGLYEYLQGDFTQPGPPLPDVDPDNPPDPDEPPEPVTPDNPDPYYDPTSDPDSPDYDPTKDPDSPDYDPDEPHTPYRPPTTEGGGGDPEQHPPQDEIPAPVTPPSYVTTNSLFTLYNPSVADLTNLANFLWSPAWSIDTFKKIFANPLDCILGLMVMPYLVVDVGTKNMNVGNIDTGVAMRYFTKQFYDFDCGDFTIEEFYQAYLDYAPYTKVNIFLPYIGDQQLNTDEVMSKTLNVKYRFDLATGDCVAFISVDGSVLYSFSGNCAARLPLSSNNYGGLLPAITGAIVAAGSMAAGVPALGAASALAVTSMKQDIRHTGSLSGSAGLMGVQTPYLVITRPRQALPIGQNSFMGYPSFITESLGGLTGYTEVESCHLEHIPCTDEELKEIETLLKGGVLF